MPTELGGIGHGGPGNRADNRADAENGALAAAEGKEGVSGATRRGANESNSSSSVCEKKASDTPLVSKAHAPLPFFQVPVDSSDVDQQQLPEACDSLTWSGSSGSRSVEGGEARREVVELSVYETRLFAHDPRLKPDARKYIPGIESWRSGPVPGIASGSGAAVEIAGSAGEEPSWSVPSTAEDGEQGGGGQNAVPVSHSRERVMGMIGPGEHAMMMGRGQNSLMKGAGQNGDVVMGHGQSVLMMMDSFTRDARTPPLLLSAMLSDADSPDMTDVEDDEWARASAGGRFARARRRIGSGLRGSAGGSKAGSARARQVSLSFG
eukprot:1118408-Rhodomonas_salina.1